MLHLLRTSDDEVEVTADVDFLTEEVDPLTQFPVPLGKLADGVGETDFGGGQALVDGDRLLPAGPETAGPAVQLVLPVEDVDGLENLHHFRPRREGERDLFVAEGAGEVE